MPFKNTENHMKRKKKKKQEFLSTTNTVVNADVLTFYFIFSI